MSCNCSAHRESDRAFLHGLIVGIIGLLLMALVAVAAFGDDNRQGPCRYPDCPPVRGSEPWLCENVSVFFCKDVFPTLPNLNPKPKTTPIPHEKQEKERP
jgi:hypothetical protein